MSNEKNTSSFDLAKLLVVLTALFITPLSVKAATGQVDVSIQHQIIEGFGASGAWYENWLLAHPYKTTLYDILFDELGLDIYRLRNPYDQGSSGAAYIDNSAEIVAAAKLRNPSLKIMLSSWSPPTYLKSNGELDGGTLAGGPSNYVYDDYADWWADSVDDFSNHNIDADYVNIQNEPDLATDYDSCRFNPIQNSSFAGYNQAFEAVYNELYSRMGSSMPKMLAPETMGFSGGPFGSEGYIDALINVNHVYGFAHHLYTDGPYDNPDDMIPGMQTYKTNYGDYYDKPLFQTEYTKLSATLDFDVALNMARHIHNFLVHEGGCSYLYWDLFWGEKAEEPDGGLVTFASPYGSSGYTINPVYYAFKQYSAFTDPNWQRVDASTNSSNLRISAYISPDESHLTVVIINTSTSTIPLTLSFPNITILDGDVYRTSATEDCVYVGSFTQPLSLPAESITTIALTITFDTTPPAAPTNLLAAAGDEITWLDWDDNTEPDFAGYNIYRSTTPGSYSSPLNTSLLDSSDYIDNSVTNGMNYYYVVTAEDTSTNESNNSNEVSASPTSAIGSMGTILREWWTGITGSSVSDLTSDPNFPHNPTNTEQIKSLEGPTNWADSYGVRIRGYLYPPATGSYTFWIASDNNSELWLSTDGNPENAVLIANVPGFTNRRQWDKYSQQQSSLIPLTVGQKYYIEVLHKEDTGPDNVAVAWQSLPGIPQQVIYGVYLSPYLTGYYGDFTHDTIVDMNDLAEFIKLWLEDGCQRTSALDLDGDCIVNFYEFSAMAENWRRIIAPSVSTNLSITAASTTSVSLDWDDNPESQMAGYNVHRSTTSGSGYSKLNSSLLSNSNYTDDTATNGNTYYYVVTAVDIYANESGYSNEVSRLVIQENTTGFCSVDGTVSSDNSGYTGTGYADTYNAPTMGINWRISVPSSGTYIFAWRYANDDSDRPGKLLVNGFEEVSSISFPDTGGWTTWSLVSVSVSLTEGVKDIRLEATDAAIYGLANIDYLMVTGSDSLIPVSCP